MAEMECVSVGQTNPDIAGPGVSTPFAQGHTMLPETRTTHSLVDQMIYAFVVQGALSVILSLVSLTAELLHRRRDARPDVAMPGPTTRRGGPGTMS